MVTTLRDLAAAGAISQSMGRQNSRLGALMAAAASGNRLQQAMTDIAALSVATSLSSEVTGLRAASLNVSQASSMLGVADGAMSQIGNIMDRLSALSVQANSGALSESGRRGLNAEFQGLVDEIGRLTGETNFNGVPLIDGSLAQSNTLQTNVSQGTQASGALTFTALNAGNTVTLNGITLQEGVDFNAGGTLGQTVANLANSLNSDSRFAGFTFEATNSTLSITADSAGTAGNQFTINRGASTATFSTTGQPLVTANLFSLQGGSASGLSSGDVTASGVVGDSLVSGLDAQAARSTINFASSADIVAGNQISIDNGEGGFVNFTFVAGAPANNTQIQIGSTLEETLQNAANTLNNFSGAGEFGIRQLDFSVDGNQLVIENNQAGNATDVAGAALDIATTTAGVLSNAQLNNGSTGGIDVSGVTAAGFTGQIQGFEATFVGNDRVSLSVNVGGETFRATLNNTNSAANTTLRFESENGGFFDVTFAGGQGQSVTNGDQADQFATRLNQAFSPVSFRQDREISNFSATGDLQGASISLNSADFSNTQLEGVNVINNGATSFLEIEIGGETFRSDNLQNSIGAGERVTLRASNGDTLTFTNGVNQIDVSTTSAIESFGESLESAFGFDPNSGGAAFQISSSSSGTLQLGIGNLTPEALGLTGLNLLNADAAATAFAAVGAALNTLTSQRADVGAFQQALDYAAANIDSAIQNQDAARAMLEDTDIADNAIERSLLEVQRQASIATLAQTNRLQGNLLQLLVN